MQQTSQTHNPTEKYDNNGKGDTSDLMMITEWSQVTLNRSRNKAQWYLIKLQTVRYIDGLVQERRNSSALAMELRHACTNLSIWRAFENIVCQLSVNLLMS